MKILITISRILVGSLFIVSGLIKANDIMGFGFKLTEYFEPGVLNIPFFIPFADFIAAFICVAEILLGVATLLGARIKITSGCLLLLTVFFTFLTFYSAYYNKVTDCGCFGDAIKLTPWESFHKDVVLSVFILVIFIFQRRISFNSKGEDKIIIPSSILIVFLFSIGLLDWHFPWIFTAVVLLLSLAIKYLLPSRPVQNLILIWVLIASIGFSYFTYAHLPIKDFRPYAIGKNIPKGMEIPEGAPKDEYKTILYYEKNGLVKEFTSDNYPWEDSTWVWKDTKNVLMKAGYKPPIHGFNITDASGGNHTEEILANPDYNFLLVVYNIGKSNKKVQPKVNDFAALCLKNNIKFLGLSGDTYESTEEFRHEHGAAYDYYFCDAIPLKTMVRSNPGLMLLKKGTVIDMWHYNDFPSFEEVNKKYHIISSK